MIFMIASRGLLRPQPGVKADNIFDSTDPVDGVQAITISREDDVYPVIEQIQERVKRAAKKA